MHSLLEAAFWSVAGIRLHQGKTRAWNRGSIVPEDIEEISPEAWQPAGIKVLGTPIASDPFVADDERADCQRERELWDALHTVPDLQCAWQLLLQSANPRANHTMRTMPPSVSRIYCEAHDEGIWNTAGSSDGKFKTRQIPSHQQLASLPMRMGGLGLRSATRCAGAAYCIMGRRIADDQGSDSSDCAVWL